jgi:hypothetical protein
MMVMVIIMLISSSVVYDISDLCDGRFRLGGPLGSAQWRMEGESPPGPNENKGLKRQLFHQVSSFAGCMVQCSNGLVRQTRPALIRADHNRWAGGGRISRAVCVDGQSRPQLSSLTHRPISITHVGSITSL